MKDLIESTDGLTKAEVDERIRHGLQNNYEENVSKSTKDIIRDNVFTLFNFLNLSIAICLALVGAFSNLFFMAIIVVNSLIGIYQEISARNLVSKLSLLTKEKTLVLRDGKEEAIDTTEIVMDDVLVLSAGEQVPSDAVVISGTVEVNEALLTGESDLIIKEKGTELLSGSIISSGSCTAKVIHVGLENYATKIANEAKVYKPVKSELLGAIRKVSKFTSFIIIPLGAALFLEAYFLRGDVMKPAVVSSAAALLGMLPKGLALLISIALATAVIRLSKKKILVQDMYSVETLAHVDTLCLDKTGTITEGKMKVEEVIQLGNVEESTFNDIMGSYLANSSDNNITMLAIRDYFAVSEIYRASNIIAFSSDRKWGSMYLEGVGTVAFGAPEKLIDEQNMPEAVETAQRDGLRVLVLALSRSKASEKGALPSGLSPLGVITLDDPIRQNANETLEYLRKEGVDIKVISGDNPVTVAHIAKRAGLLGYEKYIDLSKVESDEEVRQAVGNYTVFGRVSPYQKKLLVQELKAQGRTVAMTGDGVNDVLALREADCSIAMAEGDSATRQISNLVLLESDFTSLPDVLFEGRRVVNNVTKVAGVFFIKTIYSLILSMLCLITSIAFPFAPIQITLIDLAIEGYPSFFLSFEEDKRKVNGKFLPTVLKRALPFSLLIIANIIFVHYYSQTNGISEVQSTTLMYYMLIAVSLMAVVKACLPLNPLRLFLIVTSSVGTYVAAMLFHGILEIQLLDSTTFPVFLGLLGTTALLNLLIIWVQKKIQSSKNNAINAHVLNN